MQEGTHKSLRADLDELISLFKKIKDKSVLDNLPGLNSSFFHNFELLVSNYDFIKKDLSEELLQQFGTPIHQMIIDTIKQLRKELGEEKPQKETTTKAYISKEISASEEIALIDKKLSNNKLSMEEINNLLDRRSYLKNNLS